MFIGSLQHKEDIRIFSEFWKRYSRLQNYLKDAVWVTKRPFQDRLIHTSNQIQILVIFSSVHSNSKKISEFFHNFWTVIQGCRNIRKTPFRFEFWHSNLTKWPFWGELIDTSNPVGIFLICVPIHCNPKTNSRLIS